MKSNAARSTQFDRFDRLVGQVLSISKPDAQKIVAEEKRKPTPSKAGKNGKRTV